MNYEQALRKVFALGEIQNGYNGKQTEVAFALDVERKRILAISEVGYFTFATWIEDRTAMDILLQSRRVTNLRAWPQDAVRQ